MWKYVQDFFYSSLAIKNFAFTVALYFLAMILTTIYVYARLDYVRSARAEPISEQPSKEPKIRLNLISK